MRTTSKAKAKGGGDAARGETGGGSCNPGEIQLLPVSPLRRHLRRSPGRLVAKCGGPVAQAAGQRPAATVANPGGDRSGERAAVTAI
jgi:hypothetical protein